MFSRQSLLAALCLLVPPSVFAISPGFPYGSQTVRGVNLGGWLVLEVCPLELILRSTILICLV